MNSMTSETKGHFLHIPLDEESRFMEFVVGGSDWSMLFPCFFLQGVGRISCEPVVEPKSGLLDYACSVNHAKCRRPFRQSVAIPSWRKHLYNYRWSNIQSRHGLRKNICVKALINHMKWECWGEVPNFVCFWYIVLLKCTHI
jgi:hypothetical protein